MVEQKRKTSNTIFIIVGLILAIWFISYLSSTLFAKDGVNQQPKEEPKIETTKEGDSAIEWADDSTTPSPKINELDTRDPNFQDNFDSFFTEYCKNNPCPSPNPTLAPTQNEQSKKTNDNEKTYCYVDKNGSFEMTVRDCQELHDADPEGFFDKAVRYCLDGKNYQVGDGGTREQREAECKKLFNYK